MLMRERLNLKYSKISRIALKANSDQNLIQRQRCALEFLKLYQSKRRFINIDESWLD